MFLAQRSGRLDFSNGIRLTIISHKKKQCQGRIIHDLVMRNVWAANVKNYKKIPLYNSSSNYLLILNHSRQCCTVQCGEHTEYKKTFTNEFYRSEFLCRKNFEWKFLTFYVTGNKECNFNVSIGGFFVKILKLFCYRIIHRGGMVTTINENRDLEIEVL